MPPHPFHASLASTEEKARRLPWHGERPWRRATHLHWDGGLPTVDLHDLSVRLAVEAALTPLEIADTPGGWILITGRGKHTGGRSRLRDAVEAELARRQEAGELRFHPVGPGRFEVIVDEEAARAARPGLGLLFWLFVALLLLGIAATLWNALHG